MTKMIFFILLSLFSFILSQECIVGRNCPYNQGICVGTSCECLDGYKNFFDPRLAQADQIYCNYKQKHHLIALVLEMFLPGFGHFYTYHYWLGLIKLILAITSIGSCYYLYHEIKVPSYIEAIKQAILNKILDTEEFKSGRGGLSLTEIAQFLFNVTFHPFWIFWAVDIYLYFSKIYSDGNGVPLF